MAIKPLIEVLTNKNEYIEDKIETLDTISENLLCTNVDYPTGKLFLQSSEPFHGDPSFLGSCSPNMVNLCRELGKYEYNMLRFILNADHTFFCLVGPPGSGKSTVLNYLYSTFILSDERNHCSKQDCPRKRVYIHIDFNQNDFQYAKNQSDAHDLLVEKLNSKLELGLYGWPNDEKENKKIKPLQIDEDLKDFWDWMIREIENSRSTTFPILNKIHSMIIKESQSKSKASFRRDRRDDIFKNPSDKLDYLICLCHYLNNIIFNPDRRCFIIWIDNIDYAHPFVEEELLKLIDIRISPYKLHVHICVREDLFNRPRKAVKLFQYYPHEGPSSKKLLCKRCKDFLDVHQSTVDLQKKYNLEPAQAQAILDHITRIYSYASDDSGTVFSDFLDQALPHLLRSLMLGAQYLIYQHYDFIRNSQITDHHILRVFLRFKNEYWTNEQNSPVCNLFYCREGLKNYPLLKLRILHYLKSIPEVLEQKSEYLSTIHEHLLGFGYSDLAIMDGVNDLLNNYHKLLINNNTDHIYDISKDNQYDRIIIANVGMKYLSDAVNCLDYIGEMMTSCAVEVSNYKNINRESFASERIQAALRFLKELNDVEENEANKYIDDEVSKTEYLHVYNELMISTSILIKIWRQLYKIAESIIAVHPKLTPIFSEIMLDYKNILTSAENSNTRLNHKLNIQFSNTTESEFQKIYINIDKFIRSEGTVKSSISSIP